jgi:predicted anti-sigma-YlaC factor YlaD
MRCETVRSAVSARLDGEQTRHSPQAVQAHLDGCAACREWLTQAERVTRAVRLQSVRVPDLTARILTAAHERGALPSTEPSRSRWAGVIGRLRVALGLLAVLQLLIAVPDLFGTVGHEAHAGREVAAFDVALAVGLLIAACYPEQARVFAPVVATLVACFVAISAMDVAQGVVTPARVAVHMIAVAQAGLLSLLARATGHRRVARS